jgi:5-methylcytosine-specific restriction protein A
MARTVPEWIGKTDDSVAPRLCQLRILDRQDNRCALTGHVFVPGDKIEFDHITALWLGGKNRESNLQAVLGIAHKRKTKAEAPVRAKVNASRAKHLGITQPTGKLRGPAFAKPDKPQRTTKPSLPYRPMFERG